MALISLSNVIKEIEYRKLKNADILDFLDEANGIIDLYQLTESEYNKITPHLRLDILDIEKFVRVNQCKPISNPRAFTSNNIPSKDGLLSNEIFGYNVEERAGTFGYIDLNDWFIDPSCYKTWIRLDSKVKNIVHGVEYYKINDEGLFEKDPNGNTGVDWLRKNMDKIKFKRSSSNSKDLSYKYLEMNRDRMFIKKYLVIPPFYRDKNSGSNSRVVGLGGVNKLYTNLIVAANALTATQDYNFDSSDAMKARVQEIILNIYDWFCGNRNVNLENNKGTGLSGKLGIMRRTALSKTTNFSSRLVISGPELKVEKVDDMEVSYDKSAVPLYALMSEFRDFVTFQVRRFFENEFAGTHTYPVIDKNGKLTTVIPKNPEVVFSDDRIKQEMDRFLHGYNNRFVPVELPVENSNEVYYMVFKNQGQSLDELQNSKNNDSIYGRRITWCDIFYMATVEATANKQILITRFPIDFFSNHFTTGIKVSSTVKTERVEYNGEVYETYPYIRESLIGSDTSNSFVDTLRFSNCYLNGIGGDYDGDQCTCKGVYTNEANDELRNFMNSKENFVTFGCKPLREPGADVYQSFYALTKLLSTVKVTPSSEIQYS